MLTPAFDPEFDPEFEALLPRLVATYEAGRLVPFIGSGMSLPACTDWPTFVQALEENTGRPAGSPLNSETPPDELIRRANGAVRSLKGSEPGAFAKAVRKGLRSKGTDTPPMPPQTQSLAGLWWPLVLSTNYDNCYAAAFHNTFPHRQLAVVGRGAEDCQRVLNSLSTAGRSLLWALQGYVQDVPLTGLPPGDRPDLEAQIVVGHEEYRRVTYRDLHFRRAFAEVFRHRSLLFLGAGLKESYLQELFGEVLEYYGPGTRPHYAFIQEGEVDPQFMLERFQILVVQYEKDKHCRIPLRLGRLAKEVSTPRWTPVAWSWGRIDRQHEKEWTSVPDLEVVRGPLPTEPQEGECLAVSAGGSASGFFVSNDIRTVMECWGVKEAFSDSSDSVMGGQGGHRVTPSNVIEPYLGEFAGSPVYAVRARSKKDNYDLSVIHAASLAFFANVPEPYRHIRMQLLATGGTETTAGTETDRRGRTYPERFSFVQSVRAWAAWRRNHPDLKRRLTLHVKLDSVYQDIASGRIDVLELLSCTDIRFFVEVVPKAGEIERRLFQSPPDLTLEKVVDDLQLSPAEWTVKVTPPPSIQDDIPHPLDSDKLEQTLQTLGVVPGSTIHFHRRE